MARFGRRRRDGEERVKRISPIVAAVFLPTALLAFGQGVLVTTLPLYASSLGVGYSLISLAVSAAAIGTLAADVPAGAFLARIGLRKAMIGGSALVTVSTLLLAFGPGLPLLVALRVLAGVGAALWALSRHAYLTEAIPLGQRGQAISVFGGINRLGVFAGPVLGGLAADRFGLTASFLLSGLLAGVATIVSIVLLKPAPRPQSAPRAARWRVVGASMRANGRDLGAASTAQTLGQMIRTGRYLIIPLYGADRLGLDAGQIGLILTVGAMLDVSMFVPAGWLMDRFGRKVAAVPSFGIMALGVALIPRADSFRALLVAALVIGLGNGLGSGVMMTLGADLAPAGATGEFLGIWRLIGDVGAALGPLTVGWVAASFGLANGAYVLAGIGLLTALTLAVLVRETRAGTMNGESRSSVEK
ncbi:MAG: MFS transporter [Thermomicrobiales bacterium]|nr:MFS transporter [Thermomicrobiales bacterium]